MVRDTVKKFYTLPRSNFNMRSQVVTLVLLLTLFSTHSFGQHTAEKQSYSVGVAMSGGGAKGAAYLGMLQVLDSLHIPIDIIAGSSIGGVIGGLTAMGYSPEYLINMAKDRDYLQLLDNSVDDRYVVLPERNLRRNYLLTFYLSKKFKMTLPRGTMSAQRTNDLFNKLCSPYYRVTDFTKLPIPFFCVAVDLENGNPVEMTGGSLPDALIATMSVPVALVPKEIDNKLYVDGGFVNNFPVENLKKRGVGTVIGFDVQRKMQNIDSITTVFDVFKQLTDINRNASTKKAYSLANLIIRPKIDGLNMSSFTHVGELIDLGREAALENVSALSKLSDSLQAHGHKPMPHLNTRPLDSVYIESFIINGLHNVSFSYIEKNLHLNIPGYVKFEDIEQNMETLRASYLFKYVVYRLLPVDNGAVLEIDVEENEMNTFSVGLNYAKYHILTLQLNLTMRNLGFSSSVWYSDIGIGIYPYLRTSYTMFGDKPLQAGAQINVSLNPAITYVDNTIANRYGIVNTCTSLFLKKDMANRTFLQWFVNYDNFTETNPVGEKDNMGRWNFISTSLRFNHNSLNSWVFPQNGLFVDIDAKFVFDNFTKTTGNFLFTNVNLMIPKTFKLSEKFNLTSATQIEGGISFFVEDMPSPFQYKTGGNEFSINSLNIVNYKVYPYMSLTVDDYVLLTETLQFNFAKMHFVALTGCIGSFSQNKSALFSKEDLCSYVGISYGIKTPILPIKFTLDKSLIGKGLAFSVTFGKFIK